MNKVQYYGNGPVENYADRQSGTRIGIYNTTAEDMYFPYVRPQENGHRTFNRWFSLTDVKNTGLLIIADDTLGFNALRNSVEDFDSEEAKTDLTNSITLVRKSVLLILMKSERFASSSDPYKRYCTKKFRRSMCGYETDGSCRL